MTGRLRLPLKLLTLFLFVTILLLNFNYLTLDGLHPDETYYWQWSRHLTGFLGDAPLIVYLLRLFTLLGGNNAFAVRFPALLTWVLLIISSFKFTQMVSKTDFAPYLAVLIALFLPLWLTNGSLVTAELSVMLFSLPAWYFLYQAIEAQHDTAWYGVGIFGGMTLLSGLHTAVIILSVFFMLLLRPSKRHLLLRREPYIALLIGLAFLTPVFNRHWNAGPPACVWLILCGLQFKVNLTTFKEFFLHQLANLSLLLLPLIYYTLKRLLTFRKTTGNDCFLIGAYLPGLLLFGAASLFVSTPPDWPAIVYFPAIVFLAGQLAQTLQRSRRLLHTLLSIFLLTTFLVNLYWVSSGRFSDFFIKTWGVKLPAAWVDSNPTRHWSQPGQVVDFWRSRPPFHK